MHVFSCHGIHFYRLFVSKDKGVSICYAVLHWDKRGAVSSISTATQWHAPTNSEMGMTRAKERKYAYVRNVTSVNSLIRRTFW